MAPDGTPAAKQSWDVQFTVGSGGRGHSFLTEHDGFLFQTPVSWYAQKQKWDLSPGFGPRVLTGRAVLPECLFCHANHANHVDGSVNQYARPVFDGHAIGCQRCHGPGELHVASRQRPEPVPVGIDPTIVNPRHLERPLREAVCEQCHLTGEARTLRRGRGLYDFRPGLPLEQFWAAFVKPVRAGEGQKAVSHVEQMYQSRCFQETEGTKGLGCLSCHDPHERVAASQRVAHYRGRCLECHRQQGCSFPAAERLRRTAEDSCIECHMPRYPASDIPHTAATDHRILRNAQPALGPGPQAGPGNRPSIVSFYRERGTVEHAEDDRDLAVALIQAASRGNPIGLPGLGNTLETLDAALRRFPDDVPAAEARGYALGLQGRWVEALAAFEEVLAKAPARETALVGAGAVAEAQGRDEAALGYWRRAVEVNPWAPIYRQSLVQQLMKRDAWVEVRPHCDAWLRLDPFSAEARAARVACLLAAGDKEGARAEFARIEAIAPPNLEKLRMRFERGLR
jgi:tetratricopeptide (TPR) repeat protein